MSRDRWARGWWRVQCCLYREWWLTPTFQKIGTRKTSRVDVWGKREVLPQILGKISFALMWKGDCFCCFNWTMLENIGVWTREWIDYIYCSKIFGTVGSVDQVVYPFQGKCHVNMLGSTSLVIYFPASDTVAQTNLLDSRFRDAFKKYLADFFR